MNRKVAAILVTLVQAACAVPRMGTPDTSQAVLVPPGGPPCTDAFWTWSPTVPPVNRMHVFCGVITSKNQPQGFHSKQLLADSVVVTAVTQPINQHQGIYSATVSFAPPARPSNKPSTFFPDACTVDQVMNSIIYAANHQTGIHPIWGVLGPSAPPLGGGTYCVDSLGFPFVVRMGLLNDGRVNTAFPN